MRNANQRDIQAFAYRNVPFGVMFDSPCGLVHRKLIDPAYRQILDGLLKENVLMESAYSNVVNGHDLFIIHPSKLTVVTKGPATTHRKPKNRPKKGTKPWTKIPYRFEDVEVGDIVEWLHAITRKKQSCKIVTTANGGWLSSNCYGAKQWSPMPWQEAHILKPYKEPVKPKEEEVYRIGDRFEITHINCPSSKDIVMLCRVCADKAMLIAEKGNRWTDQTCLSKGDGVCSKKDVEELIDTIACTYKKI